MSRTIGVCNDICPTNPKVELYTSWQYSPLSMHTRGPDSPVPYCADAPPQTYKTGRQLRPDYLPKAEGETSDLTVNLPISN